MLIHLLYFSDGTMGIGLGDARDIVVVGSFIRRLKEHFSKSTSLILIIFAYQVPASLSGPSPVSRIRLS